MFARPSFLAEKVAPSTSENISCSVYQLSARPETSAGTRIGTGLTLVKDKPGGFSDLSDGLDGAVAVVGLTHLDEEGILRKAAGIQVQGHSRASAQLRHLDMRLSPSVAHSSLPMLPLQA
jgi:hypothetical protein